MKDIFLILVSTGEDRKIKIWSLDSNILSPCLENVSLEHSSSVFSLCKSKNEKMFFSGSYGEIKIWSTEDFSLMNTLYGHKDYVTHMEMFAFPPCLDIPIILIILFKKSQVLLFLVHLIKLLNCGILKKMNVI